MSGWGSGRAQLRGALRRPPILLAAILVAALISALAAGGLGQGTPAGARSGWSKYRDTRHGFSVEYPASWRRARFPMFPPIINPRSLLAVSTFPIPRGAGRGECGYVPSQVIERVGAAGAAVLLTELYGPGAKLLLRTQTRPQGFQLDRSHLQRIPGPSKEWLFNFKVRDRFLTAAVVLGQQASQQLRREAVAVLDGLRFDPPPPDGTGWPGTPRSGSPIRCC
jgi:hypothetical protein